MNPLVVLLFCFISMRNFTLQVVDARQESVNMARRRRYGRNWNNEEGKGASPITDSETDCHPIRGWRNIWLICSKQEGSAQSPIWKAESSPWVSGDSSVSPLVWSCTSAESHSRTTACFELLQLIVNGAGRCTAAAGWGSCMASVNLHRYSELMWAVHW